MLECKDLGVEVGRRMDLVDVMLQVLDEVMQVWTCLDVAVHEVHRDPHLGVVVHVDREKMTHDPL